jgi:hypothetical protein
MMFLFGVRKIISYNLLFIFILFTLIPAGADDASSVAKAFNTSSNSVEKKALLVSLKQYTPVAGEKAPLWVVDLLGTALQDKSPVVVAEAAYQVGQFNAVELGSELLTLYKEAVKRFGASGYERRVMYSLIPSLGKVGNSEAKVLIADLLKNNNGSAMGEFLMQAIKNSKDPAFLNDLKLYKHKMAGMVEAAKREGADPILYSRKLAYIQVAAEVERSLLRKGGKHE